MTRLWRDFLPTIIKVTWGPSGLQVSEFDKGISSSLRTAMLPMRLKDSAPFSAVSSSYPNGWCPPCWRRPRRRCIPTTFAAAAWAGRCTGRRGGMRAPGLFAEIYPALGRRRSGGCIEIKESEPALRFS